jgi:hypothetical protein
LHAVIVDSAQTRFDTLTTLRVSVVNDNVLCRQEALFFVSEGIDFELSPLDTLVAICKRPTMETVEGAASYAPQKAATQVCESHHP